MNSPSDQDQACQEFRDSPEGKKIDEFSSPSSPSTALPTKEEYNKCVRELFMNNPATLLDAIDGFLDCFPFAQGCIRTVFETHMEEGDRKVKELSSKLETISASLTSLLTVSGRASFYLNEDLVFNKDSLQECRVRVESIVRKVDQVNDGFKQWEEHRSAFDREQQATGQSHHHHRDLPKSGSDSLNPVRIGRAALHVGVVAKYVKECQQHESAFRAHNKELGGSLANGVDKLDAFTQELKENARENDELKKAHRKEMDENARENDELKKAHRKEMDENARENDELKKAHRKEMDEMLMRMNALEQVNADLLAQQLSNSLKIEPDLPLGGAHPSLPDGPSKPVPISDPEVGVSVEETEGPKFTSIKAFFFHNSDQFKERMASKSHVDQLCEDKKIIPTTIKKKICDADDSKAGNLILYEHMVKQGDYDSTLALCTIMTDSEGYARMNKLGEVMKTNLEKNKERLSS